LNDLIAKKDVEGDVALSFNLDSMIGIRAQKDDLVAGLNNFCSVNDLNKFSFADVYELKKIMGVRLFERVSCKKGMMDRDVYLFVASKQDFFRKAKRGFVPVRWWSC